MENQSTSTNQPNNEWYQIGWLVHLLLIVFFPVGLYALWKNSKLPKWWKITATVIIAIIFINVAARKEKEKEINKSTTKIEETTSKIVDNTIKEEKQKELEKPKEVEKPKELEKPKIILPQSQLAFIQKVESFYPLYDEAPNELKKSALRKQRKDALASLVSSRRVSEWIGTLKDMQTNSEGKAFIEIKLDGAESITIKTWNNALSDIIDETLIENGSELYNSISDLSVGDKVVFSGTFASDERDYIREASITERGSMMDPEFILKFSDVRKK